MRMPIEVRPAKVDDKASCMNLLAELAGATGGSLAETPGRVFDQLLAEARGLVLVAVEEGALLGMASLSFNLAMRYGGEYCQLEELVVHPDARGKNIGALLMEATLECARRRGCAEYGLYLVETTEKNLPFYAKFGFERVGTELRQRLD
jgi:GNAT superfamily N-acetyltransferase